ncbi:MAG: RNA-binding protein [archaeon]|nr:RNA-binding protein [archaeon]
MEGEATKERIMLSFLFPKFNRSFTKSRFGGLFEELKTPKKKCKSNAISVERIMKGEDKRTSLILKNIPSNMSKDTLTEILSDVGNINYLYLPYDRNKDKNEGFALLNIINYKNVINIFNKIRNLKLEAYKLRRPIQIYYSKIQGKEKLLELLWDKEKRKEALM